MNNNAIEQGTSRAHWEDRLSIIVGGEEGSVRNRTIQVESTTVSVTGYTGSMISQWDVGILIDSRFVICYSLYGGSGLLDSEIPDEVLSEAPGLPSDFIERSKKSVKNKLPGGNYQLVMGDDVPDAELEEWAECIVAYVEDQAAKSVSL